MDYEQEMEEYSERHMSRGRKTFRRCVKYLVRTVVFLIIALLLWRVFWSDRVPRSMRVLLVNDATYQAYLAGDGTLNMYTQPQDKLIVNGDAAGYFWVSQAVIIPKADQIQVLVRYNNSTLRSMATDFKLDSVPSREENVLDVTLRVQLNGEDENGEGSTVRYHASAEPISDSTSMYNYRKYVFDGVTVDDLTHAVWVDFYYIDRVNYEKVPYGTLLIYDDESENQALKMSTADQKALAEYGKR